MQWNSVVFVLFFKGDERLMLDSSIWGWHDDMETLSTLLVLYEQNTPETSGSHYQCRVLVLSLLLAWTSCWRSSFYTPHTTKLLGGYIGFTRSVCPSVRPSVHPASCVCSVTPTVLVGSFSYLYILLSNFRRCVTCKGSRTISKFDFLVIFLNL